VNTADAVVAGRARASGNPLIQAELARVALAQKNRDLTQRNRYPDLTVGLSPSQMGSRITTWGVMVEMNIPLQQEARRSQEREAEAMVAASRSSAEACRSSCSVTWPSTWPGWRPRGAPRRW
jgi:cobalt-zinc-cadmium efflux system outer membrane protein